MSSRVALVTGAGSGIGRATARTLASRGDAIMAVDLDGEAAGSTAAAVRETGARADSARADVTRPEEVEAAVEACAASLGPPTVLVCSAGISAHQAPLHEFPLEQWERAIGINLSGTFHAMRSVFPYMLEAGGGAIVNISSIMGQVAHPNGTGYVTSKHAVVGLTRAAALDYAQRGIRVNAVGPGVIETAMTVPILADEATRGALTAATPMGRVGQPEEIAALIAFLCSEEASYITGHYYAADGGYLAQ